MTVKFEMDVNDLYKRLWSGAEDTLKDLTPAEIETILNILEDLYPDGMTLTELNDFFWFERDTIAEWLGVTSYDSLMNRV